MYVGTWPVAFKCELLCTLKHILKVKYIQIFFKIPLFKLFSYRKNLTELASAIFCYSQWQRFFTRNISGYFLVEKISRRSIKKAEPLVWFLAAGTICCDCRHYSRFKAGQILPCFILNEHRELLTLILPRHFCSFGLENFPDSWFLNCEEKN